jgi:tetratricopeptide (TPR) repeat protein
VKTQDQLAPGRPDEVERFLFYRGLGRAPLPLRLTSMEGVSLRLEGDGQTPLRHLFIVRVENGKGVYRYLPELAAGSSLAEAIPSIKGAQPLPEFTRRISDDLAARLTEAGLYPKEARAMVNTWRSSYFGSDGLRVLFVLPQTWTEAFIPMRLDPQPESLVRVMVGRVEVLTPEREKRAEQALRDLTAPEAARREAAFTFLRDQGRYVEPVIRRVLRAAADPKLQSLCRRLLNSESVTDLRSALNDPAAGGVRRPARVRSAGEETAYLRAQLTSLLREAGLDEEARKESAAALEALKSVPHPPSDRPGARHYLRATARAMEGADDDRAAMQAYARFVRFGSQVKECGGCHQLEGPRTMAWFRDWWAGRKYAEYAQRAGIADQELSVHAAALERNRQDTAAQLLLAYLYAAQGQPDRAEELWARIAPGSGSRTASRE